jgi:hypothetical protein
MVCAIELEYLRGISELQNETLLAVNTHLFSGDQTVSPVEHKIIKTQGKIVGRYVCVNLG